MITAMHDIPGSRLTDECSPHIRCPGCRARLPMQPYVVRIGVMAVLDCPVCRGARDLKIDQASN